jgi:sulfoxide reductase catalytic subunit YedY
VLIKIPKIWNLPDRHITDEAVFLGRRQFLKGAIATGLGTIALPEDLAAAEMTVTPTRTYDKLSRNPKFAKVDRPLTPESLASKYNNFYEYGGTKNIWKAARRLPLENWKIAVIGLVKNPQTYDLEDLEKRFPIEERVYRFRCVEAWSMTVPWSGIPLAKIIAAVEPTSQAKFVRFTSFYQDKITKGPGFWSSLYPWPYVEGLRIEEANNELAFLATGIYGHTLPKQHGAPARMVIPWKYGFKGAKSIVKIEFTAEKPATFWNTIDSNEYGFEANVNPNKPHPRWSQAMERVVSSGNNLTWQKRPTILYNGYGDFVASLYD